VDAAGGFPPVADYPPQAGMSVNDLVMSKRDQEVMLPVTQVDQQNLVACRRT
jgi:hypothetical protein